MNTKHHPMGAVYEARIATLEAERDRLREQVAKLESALLKANTAPRWLIGREAAGAHRKGR